jgi:hypothetical protein
METWAKRIPADGQSGVLIPLSNRKSIGKAKAGNAPGTDP